MADLQKNNEAFLPHELRSELSWKLFLFLAISLSSVIFLYLGLQYGYKLFLSSSINTTEKLTQESNARVGADEQKNLIDFYSQIVNLKSLLGSHVFSSKLFSFLEAATSPDIAYVNLNLNTKDRTMSLSGIANSYEAYVAQVIFFEQSQKVEKVILGLNSIDGRFVKFDLKLTMASGFFDYDNITVNK